MKKFLALIVLFGLTTSFSPKVGYPCHILGDVGPCTHPVHAYDYDAFGNVYACGHRIHANDIYPCTHVCW